MNKRIRFFLMTFASLWLLSGCSKDVQEYNKPALYWYDKIVSSISDNNLDKADDYYASLQGEHIGSPLLPEATMILAVAHMHNEEYLLTEHFLNEYVHRYAKESEIEFAEFLKIKAKYLALPNPRRDQVLISKTIESAKEFKIKYPHSQYYALVDTILSNLYVSQALLNESIASLYDRIDKHKSAAYYRAMIPKEWISKNLTEAAEIPWYKEIFEGDGTSSWYAFLIPDTQSIVSRNTVSDTNESK